MLPWSAEYFETLSLSWKMSFHY